MRKNVQLPKGLGWGTGEANNKETDPPVNPYNIMRVFAVYLRFSLDCADT